MKANHDLCVLALHSKPKAWVHFEDVIKVKMKQCPKARSTKHQSLHIDVEVYNVIIYANNLKLSFRTPVKIQYCVFCSFVCSENYYYIFFFFFVSQCNGVCKVDLGHIETVSVTRIENVHLIIVYIMNALVWWKMLDRNIARLLT